MVYALLAHVTISSLTQYSLVGIGGFVAGLVLGVLSSRGRNPVRDDDGRT